MRTNKCIILFLLLLVFCRCAKNGLDNETIQYDERTTISRGECFPKVSDRYVYPVVPGTEEWNRFVKTADDAFTVSQLPDDVLKSISTPGLIDALIHAPAFMLYTGIIIHAVDPTEYGWHSNYQWFNSAGELFQRKDAGQTLVAYYKLVSFDCISNGNEEDANGIDADFVVGVDEEFARFIGLEVLFSKQEVLDNMNHEQKKEAVYFILKIYKLKNYVT